MSEDYGDEDWQRSQSLEALDRKVDEEWFEALTQAKGDGTMSETQVVYVNVADKAIPEYLGIREAVREGIAAGQWGMVNAPRPLPGTVTWEGEYRHGTFYAAGPLEIFRDRWAELDGWPVKEITNEEIEARLEQECVERSITLEEILEDWDGNMRQLAGTFGLPWHEAETKMPAGADGK